MRVCLSCLERFTSANCRCPHCGNEPAQTEGIAIFAPALAAENSGFEPATFEELYALEEKNFWFRARNRLLLWSIRKYFAGAQNFLEVGCGTGFVLTAIEREFLSMKTYGTEIFTSGLAFARRRVIRSELFQSDARAIPYAEEFDLIGSFDVIEHILEDDVVLRGFYVALKKGGGLLLTVPQHPFLWSDFDEYSHHVRRYTSKELYRKLEDAGFEVEQMGSFVSVLFPLLLISRFFRRRRLVGPNTVSKSEKKHRALVDLKLPWLLNAIFNAAMTLELWLIRGGIIFPFGGSLFAVAKKK